MEGQVEHYKGLLNTEFPWDKDLISDALLVKGPKPSITNVMVSKAISKMKPGESADPSGIVI